MFYTCFTTFKKSTAIILLTASFLLISCAGRSALRQEKINKTVTSGDFLSAVSMIKDNDNLYGRNEQFLYYFDIGVLYHYAGLFDSSTTYLMKAADVHDQLFARSITNEAAAIMTNDNMRPYRSKRYELVMLHLFTALNFKAQGRIDEALVESRRMQLHFDEWQRTDSRGRRYTSDGLFHLITSFAYQQVGESSNSLISLYKAVQAYQRGPVKLPPEVKGYAYNRFVRNDRADDTARLNISAPGQNTWPERRGSEIVLISYAGRGPVLKETAWSGTYIKDGLLVINHKGPDGKNETISMHAPPLPASEYEKANEGKPTRSGTTFHVKFALPTVKTFPSRTNNFSVLLEESGKRFNSVMVNDLDATTESYLQENLNTIVARTAVRVVLRTIAAERAKARVRTENPLANLMINLGTDVLSSQMERADVRGASVTPKTVHMTRIPVEPGVHNLVIDAHDRNGNVIEKKRFEDIAVRRGQKKYLFHHSFK
ncbi:hypothetical protein QA601_16520 [Chitinispirillales bacterium ANBcel5]|uniref:hypothetical protein n=1 Tax=Cellulosispirillum alkaliphilum TaxID=3039283 RepID=UPI002A58F297|nr:hypothetical protein [Chitinispirillales bacterium ANBcel5]